MREILRRHEALVEIIFAVAVFFALIFAIYMRDAVTVGTIIGGIFGYMKGRKDGEAVGPTAAAPPAGNQAGFVSVRMAVILLVLCALLGGCATFRADPPAVQAGKGLAAMGETIRAVAVLADNLCDTRMIPEPGCLKLRDLYTQVRPAYVIAVDAAEYGIRFGATDGTAVTRMTAAQGEFFKLYNEFMAVSAQYGALGKAVK